MRSEYKVPPGTLVNMHLQPTPAQKSSAAAPSAAKETPENGRRVNQYSNQRTSDKPVLAPPAAAQRAEKSYVISTDSPALPHSVRGRCCTVS